MGNYKKYSDEFKQEVLAMVAAGERSVSQIERDLDITPGLIYKWQQRYRVEEISCNRVPNEPNKRKSDG